MVSSYSMVHLRNTFIDCIVLMPNNVHPSWNLVSMCLAILLKHTSLIKWIVIPNGLIVFKKILMSYKNMNPSVSCLEGETATWLQVCSHRSSVYIQTSFAIQVTLCNKWVSDIATRWRCILTCERFRRHPNFTTYWYTQWLSSRCSMCLSSHPYQGKDLYQRRS